MEQDIGKMLAPTAPLRTIWKEDFLNGVRVITGTWADGSPLKAIPYYTRANRLPAEGRRAPRSTVWIKEK